MKIAENIKKYQEENSELIEYIDNLVMDKFESGRWDKGIDSNSKDLTKMLLYEYATSLEKITKGKVSAKFVIDKIARQMGTLRYGDYKKGIDDNIKYANESVTSEDYKKRCRIDSKFGAHAPTYMEENEEKIAIALFDNKQQYIDKNGKRNVLSGIDLSNLADIRGTIFHELTHVMEVSLINASELKKEDIIFRKGNSTYINTMISPELTIKDYEKYIEEVDELLKSNKEVAFNGISTIEINKIKSPNKRIMHNQISEGATEYISRLVMAEIGEKVVDDSRYANKVAVIKKIFELKGIDNSVATYIISSKDIIKYLEQIDVKGKDLLHYASGYVNIEKGNSKKTKNNRKSIEYSER